MQVIIFFLMQRPVMGIKKEICLSDLALFRMGFISCVKCKHSLWSCLQTANGACGDHIRVHYGLSLLLCLRHERTYTAAHLQEYLFLSPEVRPRRWWQDPPRPGGCFSQTLLGSELSSWKPNFLLGKPSWSDQCDGVAIGAENGRKSSGCSSCW